MNSFDKDFFKVGNCLHPHACIIYDDLDAYRRIASKYIFEGLTANEKCIMVVGNYHKKMIETDFADAGVDFLTPMGSGKLTIIDIRKSYAGDGGFDPDQTINVWQEESNKAINEGYDALRVVEEAGGSAGGSEPAEKFIYYENIINEVLFPDFPFKSLCVYDKSRYKPEVIKAAICTHPIFFHNTDLYIENIHYVPPKIHFKGNNTRDEIEIWLANVKHNSENLIALRESEKKFRSMFEKAPTSYQSLDENGNFIDVNETWLRTMGYERGEVIGHNFSKFLHPDWKDHFKENFPRFKAVGEILGVEFEMVKKDGSMILVSFHGKIGKDSHELFKQTHCIFQDITDRKRIEEALRKSEERYREIVEGTDNLVTEVDAKGELTFVNEASYKIFGLPPEECIGRKAFDFIHPEDRGDTNTNFNYWIKEKKENVTFENRQVSKSGQIRDMLWTINIKYTPDGEVASIKSIARDITERKKVEQALKRAHEELETRVENRTKKLSETVRALESKNREIEILTEMGDLLQVCATEDESYKVLLNSCKKIWPDSKGFLGIFDKNIRLNTIEACWGDAIEHSDPFPPEECWAFRCGKCHSVIDPETAIICRHMTKTSNNFSVCIPIVARGETMGVLAMRFPISEYEVDRIKTKEHLKSIEAMVRRITELFSLSVSNIRLRKDLYERSVRDSLTGLYNRSFMEESLSREMKLAEKTQTAVSIIMMDVDHFKNFNDQYGHETGDDVLRRLGIAIPAFLRPADIVCRYGGEEIIVIMPDCLLETACERAEVIRSGIQNKVKIRFGGQYLQVTASFGVAQFGDIYHSKEEFISAADHALYQAKEAGRNTVQAAAMS